MFKLLACLLLLMVNGRNSVAQKGQNIIIITLDGMRWQEVFNGADSTLLASKTYTSKDSLGLFKKYFSSSAIERRKTLMPFLWNTVVPRGQILGNRAFENKVAVKNPYWFSYPGYSEIFTGYADTAVRSNDFTDNPNENVLAFINKQKTYKNKVACFASWNAFKRILNEKKSGFLVNDGFNDVPPAFSTGTIETLNKLQHLLPDFYEGAERLDAVTGLMAIEFLKARHPKVLFVALGETDEWAHAGKYDYYLEAAQKNDAIIQLIWEMVQEDPFYKNNTSLLITTDHGRGINEKWTSHNSTIPFSNETWIAAMGNRILIKGEIKTPQQIYQQQLAQTIAGILGFHFTGNHPVAEKISGLLRH